MKKKLITALSCVAIMSGCATETYTFNGTKYSSKEAFLSSVDAYVTNNVSKIEPLPAPISKKTLLVAIPSASARTNATLREFEEKFKKSATEQEIRIGTNVHEANFRDTKIFYDAIQKRNIYAATKFVAMDSVTGDFPPSADMDTLYLVMPAVNSVQWFYSSTKNGKQVFSADRSNPDPFGKVKAFVEAVQVQAIQNQ